MALEESRLPLTWTGFPARKVFEETSKCARYITQCDWQKGGAGGLPEDRHDAPWFGDDCFLEIRESLPCGG